MVGRSTRSLDFIVDVDASEKLKSATFLMGVGLLPMLMWFVYLVNLIIFCRRGNCGLSDLPPAAVFGVVAYVTSFGLAGFGAIAARRELRNNPRQGAALAKLGLCVTGVVLIGPWVLVVWRLFR